MFYTFNSFYAHKKPMKYNVQLTNGENESEKLSNMLKYTQLTDGRDGLPAMPSSSKIFPFDPCLVLFLKIKSRYSIH